MMTNSQKRKWKICRKSKSKTKLNVLIWKHRIVSLNFLRFIAFRILRLLKFLSALYCKAWILPNKIKKLTNLGYTLELICEAKLIMWRSRRPGMFYKIVVLRSFVKFSGNDLCRRLFFNKVASKCNVTSKKLFSLIFDKS